jgi:hypothetical protein
MKEYVVQFQRPRKLLGFALIGLLLPFQIAATAYAQTAVQGYNTAQQLHTGTIVRLNPADLTEVEPASYADGNLAIGVVVDSNAPARMSHLP